MKPDKILCGFFLLVTFISFAQRGFKEKREQIKSLKVAYITDQLELTPDEAAKFWPLYNAFDDKQTELRQEKLRAYLDRLNGGDIDKLTDKEASGLLIQMENTEDELYQGRKKFIANLKVVLSPKKIIRLKKAEEGFNRRLLRQYRDKMEK